MNFGAAGPRLAAAAVILGAAMSACGGGGGGGGGGQPSSLTLSGARPDDGTIGSNYSFIVVSSGGAGNRTLSISAGNLPAGLAINGATGQIAGVPTGPAGISSFTVQVVDSGTPQQRVTQSLSIDVNEALVFTTTSLPDATIGLPYNQAISATGGTAPYSFFISSAQQPPAGLALSTSGVISGTPSATANTASFTVQIRDNSQPAQANSTPLGLAVTLEITTTSLPDAIVGEPYDQQLQAHGGQLPYGNWRRTGGALPAGIADPTPGGLVGGVAASGCSPVSSTFDVAMNDSASPPVSDAQAGIMITARPGPLAIQTQSLPDGNVGAPYSAFVVATGGVAPYTFAVTLGFLPAGLSLNQSTGEISGTPTTVSSSGVEITVTDTCTSSAPRFFSTTVLPPVQGRNDTISTATPLGNGSFNASISPSGHPNTTFSPDQDYYRITTTAASTVTVDIDAQINGSPLDPVIEFVNASGTRLNTCVAPAFNSPCAHDDEVAGVQRDSFLQVQVGANTTFFVRVLDWRGDARPDLTYTINISGVN